ncbi:MAG: glycerol-3-phosphate dehydrogenase [Desulfobulbus propionicus]|nr:MAG: glycerol-3-phosphate dehydrogenase [Desulfobulbus propionicus]
MSHQTVSNQQAAVIGAGSWGTALAVLLAKKGIKVRLWGRDPHHVSRLIDEQVNQKYLPGVKLPENLLPVMDLGEAVQGCRYVVMAIPSHGYRHVFFDLFPQLSKESLVLSAAKGIEDGSHLTMTKIMADVAQSVEDKRFGVLSGPSFAQEVATGQPTAVTVAFSEMEAAVEVQELLSTSLFRVYSSTDVTGVEICGAVKNIIAIAAGISEGLGFGLNARAGLVTRGLAEITRLGVTMGGSIATFSGLAGLGDLVLTCTGNLSRNRTVGLKLGQGKTLEAALEEIGQVAEGVKTTKSCFTLRKELNVEMPIIEQVYAILYEGRGCAEVVRELFQRDLRAEGP